MVKTIDRLKKLNQQLTLTIMNIESAHIGPPPYPNAQFDKGRVDAYQDCMERLTKLIGQLPGG
jgi:hypothetical protein